MNINHNAIYIKSFMDELAKEVGMDALEFRRKLMGEASEAPRGAQRRRRKGRLGQALGVPPARTRVSLRPIAFGSYVAACADVSVDGNKVKIHRIVAATDPGYAADPGADRTPGRQARSSTA